VKRVVFRRVLLLAKVPSIPYICFLMPVESDYDWPPRIPRESERIVSKRIALKALCDMEPSTIDLVVEKDIFVLNSHFEINLCIQNDTLDATLGMTLTGLIQQSPQTIEIGEMHTIVRRQVQVREDLVTAVLAKLAAEEDKNDLRIIADSLMGQVAPKATMMLETQYRWDELEESEKKLRSAYEKILAGRLPQNSE
jgi:hypothetical protein